MKTFWLGGIAIAATLFIQSVPASSQGTIDHPRSDFFFGGLVGALVLSRPRALLAATRVTIVMRHPALVIFRLCL